MAATRWVKGLRGLNYEERLKALKLQSLEKDGYEIIWSWPTQLAWKQSNCSSSPEGQD